MAPRESGTHWPPGWKTQDERTSTGTRGERLVEKNSGAKDGAKGVAHNESPASRRTKAQVGRMVERGQSDKVSEGQQRRLGVTQGRKYCGASHATLDTAREEQQRSQLQRARRERVVARSKARLAEAVVRATTGVLDRGKAKEGCEEGGNERGS
ncbi:hypothetical protein ERJ75_001134600 [Trypanosoma vivax]|nr:hypothetical protein ERJ75_001134600 [Trypanosoma vivax]